MAGEERVKETMWVRCSAWGKHGEVINEHFKKGKPILVEGQLKFDSDTGGPKLWTRKSDGSVGSNFEINVDNWRFLPDGGGGESGGSGGGVRAGAPVEEDEIPF